MRKILIDEATMKLALNKAFQIGQRYWSWADSEYSSHWKKADAAKAEFDQLVQDTINAALAEQPARRDGLEMVDDEGENQAVRMFLALYGGQYGITAEQMRKHLKMAGFDGAWPEWASNHNGHLTKAGAQLWIRHLFSLEQPAQQEPVAAECNFVGTKEWGRCSIEHHNLVQSEPHNWPGYQTRLLYTSPQPAQQKPLTLQELEAAWNAQADHMNTWDELGLDEIVAWAQAAHNIKENT